jgi:hypothetical protein
MNEQAYGGWDAYADTRVTIWLPDGQVVVFTPLSGSRTDGRFPFAAPVHVLTAWNPGRLLDPAENEARQDRLAADLRARGVDGLDAVGAALDGSHAEDSIAVVGMDRADVLALTRRFDQDACFEITADAIVVLDAAGTARSRRGWHSAIERGTRT